MFPPLIQELIEFDNARQRGTLRIAPHVHHCFQMDMVLSGQMRLLLPGRTILLRAGQGTLLPPLAVHGFAIAGAVHHMTFKFHVHPTYYGMFSHEPRVLRFSLENQRVARSVPPWGQAGDMLAVQQATGAAVICLAHAIRTRATANTCSGPPPSPQLWAVVNAVIARPEEDWTVQKLAESCHWTEGHFSKMFIQWFGQSPRRFLLESRMSVATRLLGAGDIPIKLVARQCGYSTVHSFSRAFKRATGFTPARYVKPHRAL